MPFVTPFVERARGRVCPFFVHLRLKNVVNPGSTDRLGSV